MTALALGIGVYGLAVLALPGFGAPFVADRWARMPVALAAHLAGGSGAIALGPWQLNAAFRGHWPVIHRWMGRGYVLAVLVSGCGALVLAPRSEHGLVTHVGFGILASLWLTTTAVAYGRIRAGDRMSHRRWMIRSYALTLAAVTLRMWLPLCQLAGIPFADAYQVVAWLCWVPNLIVAEWLILDARSIPLISAPTM